MRACGWGRKIAVEYNDTVIYPGNVRINLYYLDHKAKAKDFQMNLKPQPVLSFGANERTKENIHPSQALLASRSWTSQAAKPSG